MFTYKSFPATAVASTGTNLAPVVGSVAHLPSAK